jgi:hypothetical protein
VEAHAMLIHFGFGLIHIGRPSGIGNHRYHAAITLCLGYRGEVPPGELPWRRIWRVRWDWLPRAKHKIIVGTYAHVPTAIDSSRWTGREKKFVGLKPWQSDFWSHRSTRRSKMYVYLTGQKERQNPHHVMYVAPASMVADVECPDDWKESDGIAHKQIPVVFINGRANVDERLGKLMIDTGMAQRSSLVRAQGKALLGSLANVIAGR